MREKNHIIREVPINDYYKASLCACLTCFWMTSGIICLIQSRRIRQLLNNQLDKEARKYSNHLYTNLIFTFIIGEMIIASILTTRIIIVSIWLLQYINI